MERIFFDESGQTGTNMFDPEQPYFALGSTNISEPEATEIIARTFPGQQGPELKSGNVLRRPTGRRQFLKFAQEVGARPDRFCAAKLGKRYVVVSKMVDHLVEPMLSEEGYDFYKDDYARRFANSVGFVIEHLLPRLDADRLLASYNNLARTPNMKHLRSFQAELETLLANAPHGTEVFLNLIAYGAQRIAATGDLSALEDSNEIHVTAALECMKFWHEQNDGPFVVVHDESIHFFRRSYLWERMTDPNIEPQVLGSGEKSFRVPIPVTSTISARSHENASLQLCDLIAGFISRMSLPGASDDLMAFRRDVIDAGFGELTHFPLDFGTDFAPGEPPRADGPDIVDQIVGAVRRKRR
ncbi:hypothetical protein HNQ96_004469 [Aminobacter lissarensis]|uniref:DUF3800 domain-containing protein n=1 Tax=Aminobacter carboxidus TaxID=376165 RepID=A0A8E1WGQ5_9HYPH|nr:DUF3800 domain-containing protein [Aminobacter lissarensis]MBB6468585.1 hypothetical protein [Aminobacter lissarensis]